MLFDNLSAARVTHPAQIPPSRWFNWFKPPTAGVAVDEKKANSFSPVFACQRVISETVMMFPYRVIRQDGNARILQPDHAVDLILHTRPNDEVTAAAFRQALVAHALLWGNGFAEIDRSRSGRVGALHGITPDCVEIQRDSNNRLVYEISQGNGSNRTLSAANVFHLRGPSFDGIAGYSIVGLAREAISAGLAAEEFGAAFWGNGAVPTGFISQPIEKGLQSLSPDGAKSLLKSLEDRLKGSSRAFKIGYLDAGMEYKPVGVPPQDAQFLESRRFNVTEVCRWFRVPPHKVADLERATFTNIEEQEKAFVNDAIMPWVIRLEQEANFKLLTAEEQRSGLFTSMNVKALLRGDSRARSEYYRNLWGVGALSTNDILRLEDENPIGPEGDTRFIPMNHMSLKDAAREGNSGKASTRDNNALQTEPVARAAAQRVTRKLQKSCERQIKKDPDELGVMLQAYDLERDIADSFGPLFDAANVDATARSAFARVNAEQIKRMLIELTPNQTAIIWAQSLLETESIQVTRYVCE